KEFTSTYFHDFNPDEAPIELSAKNRRILIYSKQPCHPTISNDTTANSRPPITKPTIVENLRVMASIGKARRSRVGLYEQRANMAPLIIRRPRRSQLIAKAKQKKPNADVCPPAKHSTRKGINDS